MCFLDPVLGSEGFWFCLVDVCGGRGVAGLIRASAGSDWWLWCRADLMGDQLLSFWVFCFFLSSVRVLETNWTNCALNFLLVLCKKMFTCMLHVERTPKTALVLLGPARTAAQTLSARGSDPCFSQHV